MPRDPSVWKWTGSRFKYIGGTQLGGKRHTVYVSPRLVVQFEMDRRGISRVAVGDDLQSATRQAITQRAMPYAISIAPRGDTLDYVSSFKAVDTFVVIAGMRRAACHLLNTSGHAAAVEWVNKRGNGHGYGVLRRPLAHLNATSPQALAQQARSAAFNEKLHPRGPGGKFMTRAGAAQTRQRAKNAAAIVKKGPASSRGGP